MGCTGNDEQAISDLIDQGQAKLEEQINSIGLGTKFKHKNTEWEITEFDSFWEDFVDEDTGEVVSIERKFLNSVKNNTNNKRINWTYNKLLGFIMEGKITILD